LGCDGGLRLCGGIDPAGMNPAVKRLGHLGIDLPAKTGQATKRCLDVAAGTAKSVVEVEVTKGGVEVVEPHQAYDPTAEPDAFRVSGRAVDDLRGFNEFVGLSLIVPGCVGRRGRIRSRRFSGLVLGTSIAALSRGTSKADQQCEPGDGEVAQNRILKLKHPSTHEFPDLFPARGQLGRAGLMPSN
jgi:hypothetical protein